MIIRTVSSLVVLILLPQLLAHLASFVPAYNSFRTQFAPFLFVAIMSSCTPKAAGLTTPHSSAQKPLPLQKTLFATRNTRSQATTKGSKGFAGGSRADPLQVLSNVSPLSSDSEDDSGLLMLGAK